MYLATLSPRTWSQVALRRQRKKSSSSSPPSGVGGENRRRRRHTREAIPPPVAGVAFTGAAADTHPDDPGGMDRKHRKRARRRPHPAMDRRRDSTPVCARMCLGHARSIRQAEGVSDNFCFWREIRGLETCPPSFAECSEKEGVFRQPGAVATTRGSGTAFHHVPYRDSASAPSRIVYFRTNMASLPNSMSITVVMGPIQ